MMPSSGRRIMRYYIIRLALLICSAVVGAQIAPASAEKRVALVIGNSAYQHTRTLPNPRNDAEAVAKLLRENGFADVTLKNDLDYRAMREAVRVFGDAAREADIALIYYGGHGLEVAGDNYLIPTDARLLRDADLEYEAVTLATVLSAVETAKRLRVVILDACRNNPLGEKMTLRVGLMRSVTRGLARIEPKGDVLVAYAARAGTLALDGTGRHSPYAEALLKYMMTPGLDVRLMFGKVRDQVLAATRQQQEPYIYGSLSGDIIPLVPTVAAPVADTGAAEAWSVAKDTTSIPALEAFVRRFGNTYYGDLAKMRLAELKQAEVAKQASEAAKKKADEEARAEAEAERQRLASLQQEEERKRTEAAAKRAAEAAKKKADDDARVAAAAAKKRAEEEARAKKATEEAAERKRLAILQQEQKQKSRAVDTSASAGKEKGLTEKAAKCVAKARAMLKNVGSVSAIAVGATDCGYSYGAPSWGGGRQGAEQTALRNCRKKTTGCMIVDGE
jgi:uncharacterized caspase-like protein